MLCRLSGITDMDPPHFSIKLDKENPETGIKEMMIKLKPDLDPNDLEFVEFNEGISNKLVGCKKTGAPRKDITLFRLYGNKTELFIDRKRELETFKILHSRGYGAPVYATFNNGISYGYIDGEVLDTNTIADDHISTLIAKHMAELHAIPPSATDKPTASVFKTISKFLNLVPTEFPDQKRNERYDHKFIKKYR